MLAGHWSDHIGRRAALVLAVLVGLAGGLVFATADSLAGDLAAGRALQGIAVALATGASCRRAAGPAAQPAGVGVAVHAAGLRRAAWPPAR